MNDNSDSKFGKKNSLTILTCLTACLGFIMLCVSVSTDNWLTTFERDSTDNETTVTAVHSGLWRKCRQSKRFPGITKKTLWDQKMRTFPKEGPPNCSYISYFTSKPKGIAEIKPPEAILYDMQPAAFFPTTGLLGLLSGCILSFLSYCDQKVKKLIFVGGGLFVLSGILLLVGIVLYVGSISQAFDSTAGSMEPEERYVYDYGESFYFSVVSFVLTEFSGIFAIYLYIAKHRHYLRIKREKFIARSQSVNSCVGLVPSVSRFSFDAPPERLINSTDLSMLRKKRGRNISTSTSVEWCEANNHNNCSTQSQWLLSNSHSKGTMSTDLVPNQSREKLVHLPPNGPNLPPILSKANTNRLNPTSGQIALLYEEEIGETSFSFNNHRHHLISPESRIFYDNQSSSFYVDTKSLFEDRKNFVISPDHNFISSLSPRHSKIEPIKATHLDNVIQSPLGNLKNIHVLSSIDDDDILYKDNANQCNCAQLEFASRLASPINPVLTNNPLPSSVLPQKSQTLTGSSRKITSV